MTIRRLLLRSLRRFAATNIGVMLGVAVATTVITGALLIGDSMRGTLSQTAKQRLGNIEQAIIGGDRFFTDKLAESLSKKSSGLVIAEGVAATPDGRQANKVYLIGIDQAFADMMQMPQTPGHDQAMPNQALVDQLGLTEGEELIIRIPQPSAMPIDAALVDASQPSLALRAKVVIGVSGSFAERFSLRAEQRTPLNVYVPRDWLAERLDQPGRVNLALSPLPIASVDAGLADFQLQLEDNAGLKELTSPRVFIDASIERDLSQLPGQRLLTYMANTIALGDRESPYAMITATNKIGGLRLAVDEIAINHWLADDLDASVGDTLTLTYYVPDAGDRLTEAKKELTVARIVPLEGPFADRTLTPDFPGLNDADSLRNWDAGPAIDQSRIRDKDEAYWDEHRATPKAFVGLETGQQLWANRFGTLTAIRFNGQVAESGLVEQINPVPLGFVPVNVKAQAEQAAAGTVDFGQLFLSLSAFIIIAAIVLTATLFGMSVEQRAQQLGLLLAIGFRRRQVMTLILGEGTLVALGGALIGLVGGVGYAYAVIEGLSSAWSGAVAGTGVSLHMTPMSLLAGPISAFVISLLAIAFTLISLSRREARVLLSGAVGSVSGPPRLPRWCALVGSGFCGAASGWLAVLAGQAKGAAGMMAGMMGFASGAALLCGLLLLAYAQLSKRKRSDALQAPSWPSLISLAALNLSRRRGRTLATIVTLSSGVFLVLAVSGFRLSVSDDPADRRSGTGGFALILESSQPIFYDLNTELGREHYALGEDELPPGSVVPIRVSPGDDASCLNLNQTPAPRLLGLDPQLLESRRAFTFSQSIAWEANWSLLHKPTRDTDTVLAIADANTAQWALKLGVGDTITLTDERGQPFTLELVGTIENSILQGSLIVSDKHFKRLFPSVSGFNMLLIDVEEQQHIDDTEALLSEIMIDEGAALTHTNARLSEYNTVQNTYLAIFQALGGLGVVLGALGLGVITARNLLERRREIALFYAVGINRMQVRRLLMIEHALLLINGLAFGLATAVVATASGSQTLGGSPQTAATVLVAAMLAGALSVTVGLRGALSGRLTDALRRE